jgi:hypothetical protein
MDAYFLVATLTIIRQDHIFGMQNLNEVQIQTSVEHCEIEYRRHVLDDRGYHYDFEFFEVEYELDGWVC